MNRIIVAVLLLLFAGTTHAQTSDTAAWRKVFTDPCLAQLIDSALVHNTDIRTANLNIVQAEASLRAARLSFLPSLSLSPEGEMSKKGHGTMEFTYNLPVSMQWELDFAGKLQGEKQAAQSAYRETLELERAAQLQVIASVASHYYTLAALDEQLAVTRQSVEIARKTVEVTESMKEAGLETEAAVSQARSVLLNVAASEKKLQQQILETENALSVILGGNPSRILRTRLEDSGLNIDHTASFPLSCLSERPDVKAAEYVVAARTAQTKIARAAFYPSLTISASAGWSNSLGEIVNPGKMLLNIVGSLLQPLFNKGRNRANLHIARAQEEQAVIAFNQALLVAGTELCDALNACTLSGERSALRRQETEAARHAYEVSVELMQNSSSTYLEVLTAQKALLQSQLSYAEDRLDFLQGQINLYKALGGNVVSLQQ